MSFLSINKAVMVLGISTNTRLFAMAVINEGRLVEHSIRLHKSSWSSQKANSIVASMEPCIRRNSVRKVVLLLPAGFHQTREFKRLYGFICRYFDGIGIPIEKGSPEIIYRYCGSGQRRSKKPMMKALAERFPKLHYYYHKELSNKRKYYVKVFEALAMALHFDR